MEAAAMALNQKVVDKFGFFFVFFCFLFFFKVCAEGEGARQGTRSQRLLLSLSLPLFLPFSLFSHPSFFATLLFPSFLSLYPLLFPNFFFSLSFSLYLFNFLFFLSLSCCVPWFLPSPFLSPFHSLVFSIFRSFCIFFSFFFLFFSLSFFFFCLGEAPPEGILCKEQALYIVYFLKAPLFKKNLFLSFSALGNALGDFGCKLGNS